MVPKLKMMNIFVKSILLTAILVFSICAQSCTEGNSDNSSDVKPDDKTPTRPRIESSIIHYVDLIEFSGEMIEGESKPYYYIGLFNKQGDLIVEYSVDPSIEDLVWEYDESGNINEIRFTDHNGGTFWMMSCEYDSNRNPTECYFDKPGNDYDRKTVYVYDEYENVIEQTGYNADGSIALFVTHEHDDNGNNVQYSVYDSTNSISSKHVFIYDDNNNLTTEEYYYVREDENLQLTNMSKYDTNGDEIEIISYGKDGTSYPSIVNTYLEYDEYGNWTKAINTRQNLDESGEVTIGTQTIWYRTIGYYED